jgi:hypothetical protein
MFDVLYRRCAPADTVSVAAAFVFAARRCRSRACTSCCLRWHLWRHPRTWHNSRSHAAWTRYAHNTFFHLLEITGGNPVLAAGSAGLDDTHSVDDELLGAHNLPRPGCLATSWMYVACSSCISARFGHLSATYSQHVPCWAAGLLLVRHNIPHHAQHEAVCPAAPAAVQ